jgi:hypothetical protein
MQSWPFVGVLPCCGSALERMNANSDDAIFEKRAITCWAKLTRLLLCTTYPTRISA